MANVKPHPKDKKIDLEFIRSKFDASCNGCANHIPAGESHLTGIDGDSGYSVLCLSCCLHISNKLCEE